MTQITNEANRDISWLQRHLLWQNRHSSATTQLHLFPIEFEQSAIAFNKAYQFQQLAKWFQQLRRTVQHSLLTIQQF